MLKNDTLAGMKKLIKKPAKGERERLLLIGLVDLYLEMGRPISSNTLRENGFESLSSATIRNYFAKLEEAGYLRQQHSSGGRVPTPLAYKLYAELVVDSNGSDSAEPLLDSRLYHEGREVANYLQESAEVISELSQCAAFLSAPRFDQDLILDARFVNIDPYRSLCILISDFGLIHTETLYTHHKLSSFSLKRIENYFRSKLTKQPSTTLSAAEEKIAEHFYQEVMLRRIAHYANFTSEEIYRTGFSQLLSYPDFSDTSVLAGGLALFENTKSLTTLLTECTESGSLSFWIGADLTDYCAIAQGCSVIAVPYHIGPSIVGALAILGPHRIPYKRLLHLMQSIAKVMSHTLTECLHKYKISYRLPSLQALDWRSSRAQYLLLEDN